MNDTKLFLIRNVKHCDQACARIFGPGENFFFPGESARCT